VAISDVQAGRIGEYLLAVYAMLTSRISTGSYHARPARGGRKVRAPLPPTPGADAFSPFRAETKDVGARLTEVLDALPASTKPLPGARL